MFFAVSKQIPVLYSADRGRAEIKGEKRLKPCWVRKKNKSLSMNNPKLVSTVVIYITDQ